MEYIKYAFTGVNIIPSVMLCVMILYWIMTILGFMTMDIGHKLDIDLDMDGDGIGDMDSSVHGEIHHGDHDVVETLISSSLPLKIIKFLNIGTVPLTIYLTLLILILWVISMLTYFMGIAPDSAIGILFFILFVMASFLITKIITEPFKKFFIMLNAKDSIDIIGHVCELKFDADEKSIGQAEYISGKHDILLNVLSENGELKKGEKVYIMKKSDSDNVYIVKKAEEI